MGLNGRVLPGLTRPPVGSYWHRTLGYVLLRWAYTEKVRFQFLSLRHLPPIVLYRSLVPPITADRRTTTRPDCALSVYAITRYLVAPLTR